MKQAKIDPTHQHERILNRRAGRARRSRWLGRLVFSLTGMGLLLMLRMNPTIVADVVGYVYAADHATPSMVAKPSDIRVRVMPGNTVPVRRAGTLQEKTSQSAQPDTQAQANAVGTQLKDMDLGG